MFRLGGGEVRDEPRAENDAIDKVRHLALLALWGTVGAGAGVRVAFGVSVLGEGPRGGWGARMRQRLG